MKIYTNTRTKKLVIDFEEATIINSKSVDYLIEIHPEIEFKNINSVVGNSKRAGVYVHYLDNYTKIDVPNLIISEENKILESIIKLRMKRSIKRWFILKLLPKIN